jgi:hypothetical protein
MRLGALRTERSSFDSQWEEAAARLIPAHRDSFTSRGQTTQGQKKTENQFDSTAAFACQRFATVMESLVTPQSIWHRLKVLDKTLARKRAVRIFFDDLSQCLYDYRYRPVANFVGNSQQVYQSLGAYGNGALFVDKPELERGLRYKNIHLGECYFVENHAGVVDGMYRPFMLTARQVAQRADWKVPESVTDAAKNPQQADTKKYEILHVVLPNADRDPERVDAKGMKFAEHYILVETQDLLGEGGYRVFPFATARSMQASGETYGRGPGQWVLGSIKLLNEQKKTVIKQGHRQVDPVLLTHDDGKLGTLSMKAGAQNAGGVSKEGRLLVQPLPTGNLAVGDKMMEMEKAIIHDAFLITLFQILVDTPQMTATEVLERAREKGMLLAPTAGKLQSGWLGPMIEREIDLLAHQGLLPKMPPILAQAAAEYRIEYDNPLSRMARSEPASGFMRALGSAAEYTKMTGDMSPLDWFNFDAATPELLDIHGAPARWVSSEDEVAAKRQGRAQQAETQQMIEAAPAAASLIKSVPQGKAA